MRECECWEPNIVSDGKGCRCSICDLPPRENDPDILRERIAELQQTPLPRCRQEREMSIIAPRRPPFPSAWEQSLEDRLIDAQCTIAELRKRIAELELQSKQWRETFERCLDDMADERQRRESAEATLANVVKSSGYSKEIVQIARAHFSRYPDADRSGK